MIRHLIALLLLLTASAAIAQAPVRIVLETGEGPITVELARKQAPITAGNFLK